MVLRIQLAKKSFSTAFQQNPQMTDRKLTMNILKYILIVIGYIIYRDLYTSLMPTMQAPPELTDQEPPLNGGNHAHLI
jgi:hypothetical protein